MPDSLDGAYGADGGPEAKFGRPVEGDWPMSWILVERFIDGVKSSLYQDFNPDQRDNWGRRPEDDDPGCCADTALEEQAMRTFLAARIGKKKSDALMDRLAARFAQFSALAEAARKRRAAHRFACEQADLRAVREWYDSNEWERIFDEMRKAAAERDSQLTHAEKMHVVELRRLALYVRDSARRQSDGSHTPLGWNAIAMKSPMWELFEKLTSNERAKLKSHLVPMQWFRAHAGVFPVDAALGLADGLDRLVDELLETRPDDLVKTAVACSRFATSRATIKRDVSRGRLRDYRPAHAPKNSAFLLSRAELSSLYPPR